MSLMETHTGSARLEKLALGNRPDDTRLSLRRRPRDAARRLPRRHMHHVALVQVIPWHRLVLDELDLRLLILLLAVLDTV